METEERRAIESLTSTIKSMNETVSGSLADMKTSFLLLEQKVTAMSNDICEQAATVSKLVDIIKGNGDREGLMPMTRKLSTDVSRMVKEIEGEGDKNNPGLMSRVELIEEWIQARVWVERIVIGGVIIESIAILFLLAKVALGLSG